MKDVSTVSPYCASQWPAAADCEFQQGSCTASELPSGSCYYLQAITLHTQQDSCKLREALQQGRIPFLLLHTS